MCWFPVYLHTYVRTVFRNTNQGHWVVLNNIHLMPRWLPSLDKRLDYFKETGSNPAFRVILSSDPSNMIPVGILQRCELGFPSYGGVMIVRVAQVPQYIAFSDPANMIPR